MRAHVHKFGGTSVGRLSGLQRALSTVAQASRRGPVLVVVSALAGVTDELFAAAERLGRGELSVDDFVAGLETRHVAHLAAVAEGESAARAGRELAARFAALASLLRRAQASGGLLERERDELLATGERLSVPIFVAGLARLHLHAESVDAAELITTDDTLLEASWDWPGTRERARARLLPLLRAPHEVVVVPGFLAGGPGGRTTLLGRGGSDTTATLLGAALEATAVEIWTDVDGVFSADPRLLPEALLLPRLSYRQAGELARLGAKVLHHRSLEPAERAGLPILVRNTFATEVGSTRIEAEAETSRTLSPEVLAVSALPAEGGLARVALVAGTLPLRELLRRTAEVLRLAQVPLLALVAASPLSVLAVVRERDRERAARRLHQELIVAAFAEVPHALAS